MSYKNIKAEIPEEKMILVKKSMKEIDLALPFTINLTLEEKRALPKMGDKSIVFVEKALEFASENTQYLPSFVEINDFKQDIDLAKDLKTILRILEPLTEKITDTFYAVGSEAFTAALIFYSCVKRASKMGVPGSDTIAKELQKRYKF